MLPNSTLTRYYHAYRLDGSYGFIAEDSRSAYDVFVWLAKKGAKCGLRTELWREFEGDDIRSKLLKIDYIASYKGQQRETISSYEELFGEEKQDV